MGSRGSKRREEVQGYSTQDEPIAIVGVGCLFPGATHAGQYWNNILAKKDLITEIPPDHWLVEEFYDPDPKAPDKTYSLRGGFLSKIPFDPVEFGIPPSLLQYTDSSQLLALIVAKAALEDAFGKEWQAVDRERVGVILGASGATSMIFESSDSHHKPIWRRAMRESGLTEDQIDDIFRRTLEYQPHLSENSFPGSLLNVISGRIANRLDFHGTNCTVDAACASSLAAMAQAVTELMIGRSDVVLTGGIQTVGSPVTHISFSKSYALSPTGISCPFDEKSDGLMVGEGLALFILKRLSDAERDGNKIYALIRGIGSSSDGRSKSIYAPEPAGQARALRRAYQNARYSPDTVELMEAHGTSTKAGDAAELKALNLVFNEGGRVDRQWCALGSVKSQIGHTGAAAGGASFAKTVLALHHKVLPPTINVTEPNKSLNFSSSPFFINTHALPWIHKEKYPRRASVSSFGFGGTNYHFALEEYRGPGKRPERLDESPAELFLFSGKTPEKLIESCQKSIKSLQKGRNFSRTALDSQKNFSVKDSFRVGIVTPHHTDFEDKLGQLDKFLRSNPEENLNLPTGLYYFPKFRLKKIAYLFPGQGSHYLYMGAELACRFDCVRELWDEIDQIQFDRAWRLSEIVFPHPMFSDAEIKFANDRLTATDWAQPAIGATCAALLSLLDKLGLKADMVAGHSSGEMTALYSAGAYDLDQFLRILRKRGILMAEASQVPGGMLAVAGDVKKVKKLISQWKLKAVLANYNSPQQAVLSGNLTSLQKIGTKFESKGFKTKKINVSAAFHSPLMGGVGKDFYRYLLGLSLGSPAVDVYSNTTASLYPTESAPMAKLMSDQIRSSVRFKEEIDSMYQDDANLFLEVGPNHVLTKLVGECLKDRNHLAISLDHKGRGGVLSLYHATAQLSAAGIPLKLNELNSGRAHAVTEGVKRSPATVQLDGTTYGKKYPPTFEIEARSKTSGSVKESKIKDEEKINPEIPLVRHPINPETKIAKKAVGFDASLSSIGYTRVFAEEGPPFTSSPSVEKNKTQAPLELDALKKIFFEVVAAKTGYPIEMLKPEMQLEADLGIDSITTVAILSAFRDREPNLPEIPQEQLMAAMSEIQTIGQVVELLARSGELPQTAKEPLAKDAVPAETSMFPPTSQAHLPNQLEKVFLEVVAAKTGYPIEMLKPEMQLNADLGIDSITTVDILSAFRDREPNLPEIPQKQLMAAMSEIQTIGHLIELISQVEAKVSENKPPIRGKGNGMIIPSPVSKLKLITSPIQPPETPAINKKGFGTQSNAVRLEIPKPGKLQQISLKPLTRMEPSAGELEIEVYAAGVNFMDFLKAMGVYPGLTTPIHLGLECSGKISGVGTGVKGFSVGDEIVAIGFPAFASYVTTPATLVFPKPREISFEAAATIPVVFLTAFYALCELGRISKGERVLIHSASGGVGLAAIQICQWIGAEIFTTAGSQERRDFLKSLGVSHIMDSHSTTYADEIMTITEGKGVDVVLNSLPREHILKSISLLAPFGRFLEIGKTDIYRNAHLELFPFRKNLTFFAIDMDVRDHPDKFRSTFLRIMGLFREGVFKPLPFNAFSLQEAEKAFHFMAERQHIGKIILLTKPYETKKEPKQNTGSEIESQSQLSPRKIAKGIKLEIEKLASAYGAKKYKNWYERNDDLSRFYAIQILLKMGWKPQLNEKFTADLLTKRLGIIPKYTRVLSRWLEMFRDRFLRRINDKWQITSVDFLDRDPQKEIDRILTGYPKREPSLELLKQCCSNLPGVLQGKMNPLESLIPGGSTSILGHHYEQSIFLRPFNLLIEQIFCSILKQKQENQKLRILEIGAGTGGTTSYLLPLFKSQQVEYYFTDISKTFITKEKEKFKQYPFVQFKTLNIELDPQAQGYSPHQFDIILAVDALHATQNIRESLRNIRKLMCRQGLLVLREITKAPLHVDLIFSLLDSWWRFNDFDLRHSTPLLLAKQWKSLLKEVGFSDIVRTPTPTVWGGEPIHSILIAREGQLGRESQENLKTSAWTGSTKAPVVSRSELQIIPYSGLSRKKLAPGREIIIVREDQGIAEALAAGLIEHGLPTRIISKDTEIRPEMSCGAVIYLGGLRQLQNRNAGIKMNKEAFRVAKAVAAQISEAIKQGGGWFITVQDTGGDFGLTSVDTIHALRGGLAGLAKTVGAEWSGVYYKAIDIQIKDRPPETIAAALLDEILAGGDAHEVGLLSGQGRTTLQLVEANEPKLDTESINENSVIVVSGGARGVTAASIIELAKQTHPKIVLFGRSSIIEESEDLRKFTDSAALKKAIFVRAEANGIKLTPLELENQARVILHSREVRITLEALRQAGSPVKYYPVNIIKSRSRRTEGPTWVWKAGNAIKAALAEVRREWGPITGLVHGAGVIMDRLIEDKTQQQFDIVFDTKVRGLLELLEALKKDPLKFICLFSSMAGRFGNTGQCDYAMANEVLNKIAQAEHYRRGNDFFIKSINWGIWDAGATPEFIRQTVKQHGVSMLSLDEGSRLFVRELKTSPTSGVEVIIGDLKSIEVSHNYSNKLA